MQLGTELQPLQQEQKSTCMQMMETLICGALIISCMRAGWLEPNGWRLRMTSGNNVWFPTYRSHSIPMGLLATFETCFLQTASKLPPLPTSPKAALDNPTVQCCSHLPSR